MLLCKGPAIPKHFTMFRTRRPALPLYASVQGLAKRHLSTSGQSAQSASPPASASEYQIQECKHPVGVPSFRRITISAQRKAVVFRKLVRTDPPSAPPRNGQAGIEAGAYNASTPPVHLPASDAWFTLGYLQDYYQHRASVHTIKDKMFYLPSRRLSEHMPSHVVPYELLAPLGDEPLSLASSLGRFSHWLASSAEPKQRALHQVLLHAISSGLEEELFAVQHAAGAPRFLQFSAPLALLEAAVEYNRQHLPGDCVSGLYIAQVPLSDLPQELQQDVPTPACLTAPADDEPPYAADIYTSSLWLGLTPTYTPWHRDPNHNLFCQLRGTKVVRLMPPRAGEELFRKVMADLGKPVMSTAIRGKEMMLDPERQAFVDAVWGEIMPEGMFEVTLSPRDVLFLRAGWWHSVRGVGLPGRLNASANWWFRFRELRNAREPDVKEGS